MDNSELNPICEFYRDQDLFITGATGIVGKSLVEVLLRSYPDVNKVYILLRDKKGKSYDLRLEEFKKTCIFNIIRETNPKVLDKIVAIKGDIAEKQLGISSNDLERLKNVSIVFHVAATVRFDEPLKSAIFQNLRATLETLKIAEKLKNLKKFIHVSTAYSNPYETVIKEKLYPPLADWKIIIKAAEKFDAFTLDSITPKLIEKFPNTYTFSKHLAEHAVNEYKDRLPVVIYRPSIVANAFKFPSPGFFDTLSSAVGLTAIMYSGLGRIVHCRGENIFDIIPLDVCTMFMLVVPWKDSSLPPLRADEDTRIYNVIGSRYRAVTAKYLFDTCREIFEDIPLMKCVWYPRITIYENRLFFMLNFYLFHLLPAIVLDTIIRLTGNKPFLLHIQRKYIASLNVLHFFMHNDYSFENHRSHGSIDDVRKYVDYPIDEVFNTPTPDLLRIGIVGDRQILLKESQENLPKAILKFKILKYLDMFVRYFFYYWVGKKLFYYVSDHWINFQQN